MSVTHTSQPVRKKSPFAPVLAWLFIGFFALLAGYLIVLMYAQGEYLFAILTLILSSLGLFIYGNRRAYSWRYVYPGLAGMGLFVLFPLVCTIAIAFTNYSSVHQLTFERAQSVLMDRQFRADKAWAFGLYPAGEQWQLALTSPDNGEVLVSKPFSFTPSAPQSLEMTAQSLPATEKAGLRIITQNRQALTQLTAKMPEGSGLRMSSLRQFSGTQPLYKLDEQSGQLTSSQNGKTYRPNMTTGFYQLVDAKGAWQEEVLSPGFTVGIGWKNFLRVIQDDGIQKPFLSIFVWTVIFSLLTVVFTTAVGMVLACVVQWDELKGKAVYIGFPVQDNADCGTGRQVE